MSKPDFDPQGVAARLARREAMDAAMHLSGALMLPNDHPLAVAIDELLLIRMPNSATRPAPKTTISPITISKYSCNVEHNLSLADAVGHAVTYSFSGDVEIKRVRHDGAKAVVISCGDKMLFIVKKRASNKHPWLWYVEQDCGFREKSGRRAGSRSSRTQRPLDTGERS